ncbi:HK97 gp10 family phage protein [Bacillus sp. JJ1474]|uniref:HK97 gp10 family phage protein n=1 Tax=Bacillus sp. JJ1474 TaxID=3122955 RepID=UPI003000816F
MQLNGLSEFQRDLLDVAQKKLPRESPKIMRKIGSKARTQVAKKARQLVKKKTGGYHKKWKRGKVFKGHGGEFVVRVYNASPHAHLLEHGHRMVTKDGREVGFVQGKKPLEKAMREFDDSGTATEMLSDWLDDLLRSGRL